MEKERRSWSWVWRNRGRHGEGIAAAGLDMVGWDRDNEHWRRRDRGWRWRRGSDLFAYRVERERVEQKGFNLVLQNNA